MSGKRNQYGPTKIYDDDQINFDDIVEEQFLGKGAMGAVYKVTQGEKVYAVKKINKVLVNNFGRKGQLEKEIEIMKQIAHPNIVSFYDLSQTSEFYQIKMEYIQGETLKDYLLAHQDMSVEQRRKFATKVSLQLICALGALSSHHVMNRDIKPENIMVKKTSDDKVMVKMVDLGECSYIGDNRVSCHGTFGYMAPEIALNHPYSDAIDIWSLGVTIYQTFNGIKTKNSFSDLPYFTKQLNSQNQYYTKNIKQNLILSKTLIPEPFIKIIRQMLREDPTQRITLLEILKILTNQMENLQDCLQWDELIKMKSQLLNYFVLEKRSLSLKKQRQQIKSNIQQLYKKVYVPLQYKEKKISAKAEKDALIILKATINQIQNMMKEIVKLGAGDEKDLGLTQSEILKLQNYSKELENSLSIRGVHRVPIVQGISDKLRNYLRKNFVEREEEIVEVILKNLLN